MDITSSNSNHIETINSNLDKYCNVLEYDIQKYEFDKGEKEFVIDN